MSRDSESNDDFWNSLLKTAFVGREESDFAGNYLSASENEALAEESRIEAAVESRMSGKPIEGSTFTSMRGMTDNGRTAGTLFDAAEDVPAGTRVQFIANAGSVLAYDNPPDPGMDGVVEAVKTASGKVTTHGGKVFVRWADKVLRGVYAEHLRPFTGTSRRADMVPKGRMRVASLGDLTAFLKVGSETLVHKATRDLWSVRKDGSEFVIERLFDDTGVPLKV